MIAQEECFVIHRLRTIGYSISQIARELGLDRKAVLTHPRRPSPPTYQRALRPSKLDPHIASGFRSVAARPRSRPTGSSP